MAKVNLKNFDNMEFMEKVMILIDNGILPIEEKDEVVLSQTKVSKEVETDMWEDHLAHTLHKNRRAARRRQNRLHKEACIDGKKVKTYGKEGKTTLNHNERLVDRQLFLNGKMVKDARDTEVATSAVEWYHEVETDKRINREIHSDTLIAKMHQRKWLEEFRLAMKEWGTEEETEEETLDSLFKKGITFGVSSRITYEVFENIDAIDWVNHFKELLSLEEILEFFFAD